MLSTISSIFAILLVGRFPPRQSSTHKPFRLPASCVPFQCVQGAVRCSSVSALTRAGAPDSSCYCCSSVNVHSLYYRHHHSVRAALFFACRRSRNNFVMVVNAADRPHLHFSSPTAASGVSSITHSGCSLRRQPSATARDVQRGVFLAIFENDEIIAIDKIARLPIKEC